jgi:hypothetical protein
MSFADDVHCFIALDGSFCSGERAEAEARIDPPFDRTMILLHNIVDKGPRGSDIAGRVHHSSSVRQQQRYDGLPSALITRGRE